VIEQVKGVAFPFRIDPATGGVALARGPDKIRQNVRLILGTRLGERPMLREFGTRLPSLVHDPNDAVLADLAQRQAKEALLQWEPRILVAETRVEQSEGELRMRLSYIHVNEPVADQLTLPMP